ncbi:hypothetical protein PF010_g12907 [Phytophthora fragariae]|uniref:Uncharacterized protein n=1 Tax=Phytophthora fragariae TaxID=53985 RepID=A0A6A3RS81_9STRA|nr:hypothetical protein PF003_g1688 [Phytophthora fragariae]KAE8935412.1 hypothetical protein PF009_g14642 [Phytophthora fragariae]KAE9098744.1 hypothetical protein PF006_g23291 [Phytophthora fragariae]KAE9102411.1 hypothetical protein PF007_g14767 [Phytophthora fragariae]KAE9105695.1 hypothetical protein PF010_g12907 [Phytophthora fragariae]
MVAAPDGEEGIFLPTQSSGAVLLAATETVTRGGNALVPAINVHGGSLKLPAKKELGTWVPVGKDVEVLAMNGKLKPGKLRSWLKTLGDVEMPLENEEDVHIESDDEEVKRLMIELPRAYRKVSKNDGGCLRMTTLDVQHHIDTGRIFHRSRLLIQLSKRKVPRILSRARIYQDSSTPKIILRCRELDQWCLLN